MAFVGNKLILHQTQHSQSKSSGIKKEISNTKELNINKKIERLEAENAYLKKLLVVKKEMRLVV